MPLTTEAVEEAAAILEAGAAGVMLVETPEAVAADLLT